MKRASLKTRLNTIGAVTLQTIIITAVLAIAGAGVAIIVYNTVEGKTDNLTVTSELLDDFNATEKTAVNQLAAGASSFEEAEVAVVLRERTRRERVLRAKQILVQQIALYNHTCVIRGTEKEVWCWGKNDSGQLGSNAVVGTNSPVPVQVPGLSGIQSVAVGETFSCALLMDKTVKCWGDNTFIQLGSGTTLTQSPAPVKIVGIEDVISITAGQRHACALLENGTAKCWGDNTSGKLGDRSLERRRSSPVQVAESRFTATSLKRIVQISAGKNHTCVVLIDGAAKCWGIGTFGQLGNGKTKDTQTAPTHVLETKGTPITLLANIVQIAAGENHTCALLKNKTVKCWGKDRQGQVGNGGTSNRGTSNEIQYAARLFVAATSPKGAPPHQLTPTQVVGITTAISISAGFDHTCVILEEGETVSLEVVLPKATPAAYATKTSTVPHRTASCWGSGKNGQLAYDNNRPSGDLSPYSPTPNLVIESDTSRDDYLMNIVQIATGVGYTCAILGDGTASCWGDDGFGQLANNSRNEDAGRSTPAPVLVALGSITPLGNIVIA